MKKILLLVAVVSVLLLATACSNQKTIGDSAIPSLFTSATNGSVAVSAATSTAILANNGSRQYATICNDGANNVYLSFGVPAVLSKGYRLAAAACYEMKLGTIFIGAINGIATSSTSTVTIIEK